jgi:4-amino-4-deoxy-L-arabinose transferase-like glycosyltransferase
MVYDYLRTALGADPIRFAEGFYVRYPKVAFGHWPPAYYAVQAVWYGLFGAGVWSAQCLSAATAAGVAGLLFRRLRGDGCGVALVAAILFMAMPLVQQTAWQAMSDLLTGLFVFLALLAFSDLLDARRRRRAGVGFLTWSILALLTKGTAWAPYTPV